jgi:hypothetical protein
MHCSRHVPASSHRAVDVSDQIDVKSMTSNNLNSYVCYAAVKKLEVWCRKG